jgi:Ser/Thr protein kinase RdoA (MazF antagonist)
MDQQKQAFAQLGPDDVLNAIEGLGYHCDGHLLPLNSYENRVYQVGIEDREPLVVKFYRPGRWSDAAIIEEHRFIDELVAFELPVVAPLSHADGQTLIHAHGHRFALFPRHGGRAPSLDDSAQLTQLGRFFGRLHNIGAVRCFEHRPTLDIDSFGVRSYQFLLSQGFIPRELETAYLSLAEDLIRQIRACYERAGTVSHIRLHGDCHPGNILWTDVGPHIVDFDDARNGPAIQDLWMFLSGDRDYMTARLSDLLSGYSEFRELDPRELHLVEALRTLRMMHYAAWLARRWTDPAFPRAFPWFNTAKYWDEHLLSLREQAAMLDEVPLAWV